MRSWSDDEIFSLIREYELQRCLWEKSDPNNKNASKRSEAFIYLASKFNECTESDVKEKIRSLRTVFMEILRKNRKNSRRRNKWQFFSALEFLNGDASSSDPLDFMVEQQTPGKTEIFYGTDEDSNPTVQTLPPTFQNCSENSNIGKKRKSSENDLIPMRSERFKMVKSIADYDLKDNPYKKFGDFVASSLEQINDPELEEICQLKIRLLLSETSNEACKRQLSQLQHHNSTWNS